MVNGWLKKTMSFGKIFCVDQGCESVPRSSALTLSPSVSSSGLQVEQSKVLVKEGGVQLLLTIVDTPGFGDAVDNSNW